VSLKGLDLGQLNLLLSRLPIEDEPTNTPDRVAPIPLHQKYPTLGARQQTRLVRTLILITSLTNMEVLHFASEAVPPRTARSSHMREALKKPQMHKSPLSSSPKDSNIIFINSHLFNRASSSSSPLTPLSVGARGENNSWRTSGINRVHSIT